MQKLVAEYHSLKLKLAEKTLLPRVTAGELGAIQTLLKVVADAIADGCSLPPGVGAYLATALRKIHAGKNANDAFGIKRKRGERDLHSVRQKNLQLADAVERHRQAGMSKDDAIYEVESKTGISENTIRKAHLQFRKIARREIELELEYLGKVMPITLP